MNTKLRRPPIWLWVIWGLALLLTLGGLAFDVSPWLRGNLDWRWGYFPDVSYKRMAILGAVLTLYIGAAAGLWVWALRGVGGRRAWWVVGFAALASIPIQIGMNTIPDPNPWRELMWRTTSPYIAGFYDVAIQVSDVGDFLRRFPVLATSYLPHAQVHPPGLILYFIGLERFFERFPGLAAKVASLFYLHRCENWPLLFASDAQFAAAAGGLISIPLSALAVIPLYAAGQPLLGRRAALAAILASPLVPGYILWAGISDQAFVLVTALLLWLLYLALTRRTRWAWFAAGGLLSVATFFKHSMLVLVGFAGIYTLLHLWQEREYWWTQRQQVLLNGLAFGVSLSSVWLAYWLAFGVSFLDVFGVTTEAHFGRFGGSEHYFARLFYNPYGFAMFLGFALGFLGLAALWQVAHGIAARRSLSPAHGLGAVYLLTFAILTLLNISAAEVGRVWLFLMPLAVLAAFSVEGGPSHSTGRWVATAAVLAAQALVMQAFIFGGRTIPHAYDVPSTARPVGTMVGDDVRLEGFEVDKSQLEAGETLTATLYWRVVRPPQAFYVVFTHLYSQTLGAAALQDSPPREGHYPTTCWQPDEIVYDRVTLTTAPQSPPGVYELIVGMYNPAQDNERLATDGPGARDRAVVLGTIRILPR